MLPTEGRLIDGIQRALAVLKEPGRSAEDQRLAASIDIALNELRLRQDRKFIKGQIAAGRTFLATEHEPGATEPFSVFDELTALLEQRIDDLSEGRDGANDAVIAQIVDWENALYARRLAPHQATPLSQQASKFSTDAIETYLSQHPQRGIAGRVKNTRVLSGGFSKTTVMFDVETAQGDVPLVIRAAQTLDLLFLEGSLIDREYHLLRYAYREGHKVAEALWLETDATLFGVPFMVTRRASGRNFGTRIDVNESLNDELLRDVVQNLVNIHKTPLNPADPDLASSHIGPLLKHDTLTSAVAAQIAYWNEQSANFDLAPSPLLRRAFNWLAAHVPDNPSSPSLLHGDYGLHNLLIGDDDRVSCILDWEGSSFGDPADDLVWLASGLQAHVERERVFALYVESGGDPISRQRVHYFDVMMAVRFAVVCNRALHLFETHPETGLEALQLGLLYMYHGTGRLNESVALAESVPADTSAL